MQLECKDKSGKQKGVEETFEVIRSKYDKFNDISKHRPFQ
jgi:hypothetical protein